MTLTRPNADAPLTSTEVAHRFMRAFWDGDLAGAEEWLADDARWVFQPSMPYVAEGGPVWSAREAIRRITADLFGAFDPAANFQVIVTSMIGDGASAALEYHAEGRLIGGEAYANRYAACFTVHDGKVTEVRPYNDTKHMLALIGSGGRG